MKGPRHLQIGAVVIEGKANERTVPRTVRHVQAIEEVHVADAGHRYQRTDADRRILVVRAGATDQRAIHYRRLRLRPGAAKAGIFEYHGILVPHPLAGAGKSIGIVAGRHAVSEHPILPVSTVVAGWRPRYTLAGTVSAMKTRPPTIRVHSRGESRLGEQRFQIGPLAPAFGGWPQSDAPQTFAG